MEPVTLGNTIGWYGGVSMMRPENFYIRFPETIFDTVKKDEVVLLSNRKRLKLNFN